ncbi:Mechanosensitive ion channel protein 1, mitochondrial [Linum grandiflorum]
MALQIRCIASSGVVRIRQHTKHGAARPSFSFTTGSISTHVVAGSRCRMRNAHTLVMATPSDSNLTNCIFGGLEKVKLQQQPPISMGCLGLVVPVCFRAAAVVLGWVVIPKLLRFFRKFVMQRSHGVLYEKIYGRVLPYEKSIWGALETPLLCLISFMATLEMYDCSGCSCSMVVGAQYNAKWFKAASTICFIWFLCSWKTYLFIHARDSTSEIDMRYMWLIMDRVSSIAIFAAAIPVLAKVSEVSLQSMLTVGGFAGVAIAFLAKDVIEDVLAGLHIQAVKPFSLGDTIKVGTTEGEVVEIGLFRTMLRNY